ncbi:hypothetical protein CBR56_27355 [Bacillus thuringiensis]|uniref:hypothetical protein n=1 Tax=Bacillus cereus group TaxID=86661 RepID=UPI000B43AB86|nr:MULTISPECIES: hypothetical protein [Bacillus cereus group]OTX80663.1 hypothetical protein BK728_18320 [Bacillus thuringiensis serovar chanpaisis]MED3036657.1 hypothetical protein [Bacillus tropicus]PNK22816.1 hypothetical protein CBP87_30150 [Bacillus thuringiensis]PNK23188.1 hypothetical protein CBR56_27355 [Bacillus thuringiensis]PNK24772.1 hypothetical protein CBR55_32330 [Bacillus thuringiensis]
MYPVLNDFIEKEHEGITYKKGEQYPKSDFKSNSKRVKYLQSTENQYQIAFLGPKLEKAKTTSKAKEKQLDQEEPNQEDK